MRIAFLLVLALLAAPSLSAQTFNWTSGASNGLWTDGHNWNDCADDPCPFPLNDGDIAVLPSNSVVRLDVTVFPDELVVSGNATINGDGAASVDVVRLPMGSQLFVNGEVRTPEIDGDAFALIGGTGTLRLNGDLAPVAALSVDTIECFNSSGETCDLTGSVVTSRALWMTGGGLLLVDGAVAATLDALLIDALPFGSGGPVPGDITFTGSPATFTLATLETVDFFGTVDFNGGSATIAHLQLGSANTDGLRNLDDLTVTDEMFWNSGTVEVAGVFTIASGASAISQGNNHLKGEMEVAGTLEWTTLSFTLGSHVNDPTPALGNLTILPTGLFRANSNSNALSGPGALIVQGVLESDGSVGPFPFPAFSRVSIVPDSIAIDGGDVRVLGGTLQLNRGFPVTPITVTAATFVVANGTTLDLYNPDLALDAATTFQGNGTVRFLGVVIGSSTLTSAATVQVGTLVVNANGDTVDLSAGTVDVASATVDAGTLRLPGGASVDALHVPGITARVEYEAGGPHSFETLDVLGVVDFAGADVTVLDTFAFGTISAGTRLDALGTFTLDGGVGSATWGAGILDATEIVVEAGATLDLLTSTHTYTGTFRNAGTVQHTGGTLAMNGPFLNEGFYAFETTGSETITGTGAFTNTGTFERAEVSAEGRVTVDFANEGTVRLPGGALWFDGVATLTNTGRIEGTGSLDLPSTPLVGGTLAPGLSAGLLTIDGDLTLAPDAVLDLEIGGLVPGSGHDQLAVTATATLDGSVRIAFVGGFTPAVGQAYTLVACGTACVGTVGAVDLPLGIDGTVAVGADAVVFTVTSVDVALSRRKPAGVVVVPPSGGTVRIQYAIVNETGIPVTTQTWSTLTMPDGSTVEVQRAKTITLAPGVPLRRGARVELEGSAAEGTYAFTRYVGTQGADTLAIESYSFDKSALAALATALPADDEADESETTLVVGAAGVRTGEVAVAEASSSTGLPAETALRSPFPNPAAGRATVRYELAEAAAVRVTVYDALGRVVAVVADEAREAGRYEASVDASRLAPGVYVVRLTAGTFSATQRLTVVR